MNNRFLQVAGVLALGFVLVKFGSSALFTASRAMRGFGYWIQYHGIPTLIGFAIFCGVAYFIWNMLFGRD